MEPWERHAAGAGIKRFTYAAASDHPRAGFLVTCAFRREKSATKEILEILPNYLGTPGDTDKAESVLLIKLSGSGIVFLSTPDEIDVVSVLARFLDDVGSTVRKPPSWCNRLTPIQATCASEEEAISVTVGMLLRNDPGGIVSRTGRNNLKYAVGFNSRAAEDGNTGIGRNGCIAAVAKAMRDFEEQACVDLSNPEIVVAVELLPVVGMKTPLCGVCLLPKELVNIKPRISIKPPVFKKQKLSN